MWIAFASNVYFFINGPSIRSCHDFDFDLKRIITNRTSNADFLLDRKISYLRCTRTAVIF